MYVILLTKGFSILLTLLDILASFRLPKIDTKDNLQQPLTSITVSTVHQDIPPAPHICPTYFHNQNITDSSDQK